MSTTPRTDARIKLAKNLTVDHYHEFYYVGPDFARELETELTACAIEKTYWKGVVRGARAELHEAGRLSNQEYAELCQDTEARDYVERLDTARDELTALTARLAEVERERDEAKIKGKVAHLDFMAMSEYLDTAKHELENVWKPAAAMNSQYAEAFKQERDTLAVDNARLRDTLQSEAGDLDDDIIGIDACMRCSREHLVTRLNRIKIALNPKGGDR